MKGVLDTLSPTHPARDIIFWAPTQSAKSEAHLCFIGKIMHHSPGPVMVIRPTDALARRFAKRRIDPMLQDCRVLHGLVSRDDKTTLSFSFPGGHLEVVSAKSASLLADAPVRYLLCDEIDKYEDDLEGEGSALEQAERRTSNFPNRKCLFTGTVTIKDDSNIERKYLDSTQRRYHVPCPGCGHKQELEFKRLDFSNHGTEEEPVYPCIRCGYLIQEHEKPFFLDYRRADWVAKCPAKPGEEKAEGFWINALYMPLGNKYSWSWIVKRFLCVKDKPFLLKNFVQTILAEAWEEKGLRPEWQTLKGRAEPYQNNGVDVPAGGLVLTGFADVQHDRLEVVIRAWGREMESWLVHREVIWGDPNQSEVWERLDELRLQEWRRAGGGTIRISALGVDSGDEPQRVYDYARTRDRVHPTKGGNRWGTPVFAGVSAQDVRWNGGYYKGGVKLVTIGVNQTKGIFYEALKNRQGAWAYHWPEGLDDDYFQQIVSEKRVERQDRNGSRKKVWILPAGKRNEMLDCEVGNIGMAYMMRLHLWSEDRWIRQADSMRQMSISFDAGAPSGNVSDVVAASGQAAPSSAGGGGGYYDGW